MALPAFWSALKDVCARFPRRAEVALEWSEDTPTGSLLTDPRKMTVMVRNLVNNALKFTERGRVHVALTVSPDTTVVRVADTGIGIRSEDQETIFELFRQADGSDSRRFGGTGLGLYIVRQFARQLGGTVRLESTPGQGATFTIRLPVVQSATELAVAADAAPAASDQPPLVM